MKCPHCNFHDSRVLDTRAQKDGEIRRRRECSECKERFTTQELIVKSSPHVLKKDGRREPFSKDKLRRGLQLACMKRDVSLQAIESIVIKICKHMSEQNSKEVSALEIGHQVMAELRQLDDVAYVRFASVYRTFKDVHEFVQTLEKDTPPQTLSLPKPQ